MKKWYLAVVLAIVVVLMVGCVQNNPNPANPNPAPSVDSTVTVENGDTIQVNYRGTLDDGTEFDSSLKPGRTPLEFTVGGGQMIAGFDAAVIGMKLNQEKTVTLQPSQAYGELRTDQVQELAKEQVGPAFDQLQVGQELSLGNLNAKIIAKTENTITLQLNHPLAGKSLTFWIKIVNIQKAQ